MVCDARATRVRSGIVIRKGFMPNDIACDCHGQCGLHITPCEQAAEPLNVEMLDNNGDVLFPMLGALCEDCLNALKERIRSDGAPE